MSEGGLGADWRRYPFQLIAGDPELGFPEAEGDQGAESNTYYVSGQLRGRDSGRRWAFLTIFTYNFVRKLLRADFFTLALFDLESGEYGTFSEFDIPRPLRLRRSYKLSVERGALGVSFDSEVGRSEWKARRDDTGNLIPFAYDAVLVGRDQRGRSMRLELAIDTGKPPAARRRRRVRRREDVHGPVRHALVLSERRALSPARSNGATCARRSTATAAGSIGSGRRATSAPTPTAVTAPTGTSGARSTSTTASR